MDIVQSSQFIEKTQMEIMNRQIVVGQIGMSKQKIEESRRK